MRTHFGNHKYRTGRRTPGRLFRRCVLAGLLAGAPAWPALGNPVGMNVARGTATAAQSGSRLDITASQNAYLNWQSFNVGAGETTAFHQPSAASIVWNRILDGNPSQILGSLSANGIVVLMNQNGFYFGPNSFISVGGFIATTAPVSPAMSLGSGMWQFSGPPPAASIINYGQIRTASGGSLFMVAEQIENHGVLSAPDGTLGLYAGKELLLSQSPDGRGLSMRVNLPSGSIDNTGQIIADAGTVALHARVVNQNGLVQADSVRERNGAIELVASESINLGPASVLQARGEASGTSPGGRIALNAGQSFSDQPGSQIDVSGGAQGGHGGSVEISAPVISGLHSRLLGSAQQGWLGGTLTLDPYDLTLAADDNPDPSSENLRLNANSAFYGFSQIRLQATHDITLESGTDWNLNRDTGISDPGSLLRLEAGNNIVLQDNSDIVAGQGWSVQLAAGVNFAAFHPTDYGLALDFSRVPVTRNVGGVYLNGGSGSIQSADGDINIRAGLEVLVGSGFIRTVGGGNISVAALGGDVDSGTKDDGYQYTRLGPIISPHGLGGIGTANGGNVTIEAGGNILSYNAPIGAFGAGNATVPLDGGNVTLLAGGDIKGEFMLRDGIGTIRAGGDVGDGSSPVRLGLTAGGWNVAAGWDADAGHVVPGRGDLYLNEVYNPNGSLNPNRVVYGSHISFQFDYAPDAFVNLVAGNSVQLLGDPVRLPDNSDRPVIYPPILNIEAGAGGVLLGNDLVLYPSAQGSLSIHTTDGGALHSPGNQFCQLVVSDSDSPDYRTFLAGHAATPLHLNNPDPSVSLDISGDVQNVFVRAPSRADIVIRGDAINFAFEGQNLSPDDGRDNNLRHPFDPNPADDSGRNYSGIWIHGNYFSRMDRTFEVTTATPDLTIFTDPARAYYPFLGGRLSYDPATGRLGYQGIMTEAERDILLHPLVYVIDSHTSQRLIGADGNYVVQPAVFTSDTAVIEALFAASQDIPNSAVARNGLQIGGPGRFEVAAHNMDLGTSEGIRSVGPLLNPALVNVNQQTFLRGADLTVDLTGDLNMVASQIASTFGGGNVEVNALQGRMDIGSQERFVSDDTPMGIYSAHGGNVIVHAHEDVIVNGSRIGSFGGGDVTVTSDLGTVDAGQGVNIKFYVPYLAIDPVTGALSVQNQAVFGSGILSLITDPNSDARVGDIHVTAGQDILANFGGIVQFPFNRDRVDQSSASVVLEAGRNIQASEAGVVGNNVTLHANGSIEGRIVASGDVNIHAVQTVNVTALAAGSANVSGSTVSGSIVSQGDATVSGRSADVSVISTGGRESVSGASSGARVGAFAGASAPTTTKTTEDTDKAVAAKPASDDNDDETKKKKSIQLAKTVGRVTVILPKK